MEDKRPLDTKKVSRNHMREYEELLFVESHVLDRVNSAGQSLSKEHPTSNRATRKMCGNHIISCSLLNGATCFELKGREGTDSSQKQTQTTCVLGSNTPKA